MTGEDINGPAGTELFLRDQEARLFWDSIV